MKEKVKSELYELIEQMILPELLIITSAAKGILDKEEINMKEKVKAELNEITEQLLLPESLHVLSFAKAFLDKENKGAIKK